MKNRGIILAALMLIIIAFAFLVGCDPAESSQNNECTALVQHGSLTIYKCQIGYKSYCYMSSTGDIDC